MRFLFALAIVAVFTAPVAAQKNVAIVGSSTSACYGPSVLDSCYIFKLRNYYNQVAPADTGVDNGYAVPGYTCYRGMPSSYVPPYSSANLQPDPDHNITAALSSHPAVIILNYPTNGYDSLRIDSVLFCLRTMRNTANAAGVPCFVTTTQPRTNFSVAARAKLTELKDSILLEMGFFAINFWDGIAAANGTILPEYDADGTHLNGAAHSILAQRVIDKNVFNAALPATFLQFSTVVKNNSDIISWTTAKETQVAYYEVQRSADGANFLKITTVTAGNNPGNNQYQYTDDQPLPGWSYYKILIVDKDGRKESTPVMRVHMNTGALALLKTFARNASQVVVEIQNNEPQTVQVQLLNNMGMLLSTSTRKLESGNTTLYLQTPLLGNGIYHIRVTTGKTSITGSFIKSL